ncbi:MAG TPA: short-chain dehydrogenase, partial [Nocardia sp.]|nr:short-chain dehydrogenase [Nocardia sp.]
MAEHRIDPDDLATCLRVLDQAAGLDKDHSDSIAVQRAVGHMFKKLKQRRREEARRRVAENDRAVVAATATGSPNRIDDETAGIPLSSQAAGASAGTLLRSRPCYICKQHYTRVDA